MIEDQNKFNTNYNTGGRPLTSTFQPPPRPGQPQQEEPPANQASQQAIPSGKGGQTPWNSTRSARDWLRTNGEEAPAPEPKAAPPKAKEPRQFKPPQMPKMPKFSLPKLPKLNKADKTGKAGRNESPAPRQAAPTPKTPKKARPAQKGKSGAKSKQPKVISATISGLIAAAIVLLAECGLWGFYCYSRTLPGDTNVNVSTFMYCFAVFAGNFWAGAVVRRRSLKPSAVICGVFMVLSLVISLNLFSWREIKIKMVLLKIVLTLIAAAFGFILSLVPYLINKAIKKERQEQAQRRQRQLERRQMLQQQRELEQELAKRARGRF